MTPRDCASSPSAPHRPGRFAPAALKAALCAALACFAAACGTSEGDDSDAGPDATLDVPPIEVDVPMADVPRDLSAPDADAANCDEDDDGFDALACGGDDCDDNAPDINPGQRETCDGVDQDCDARVDEGDLCGDGLLCIDGGCAEPFCDRAGLPCDDDTDGVWPFFCDGGTCVERCALDHPIAERACPTGQACRVGDTGVGVCASAECTAIEGSVCGDEVCVPYDFGFGACGAPGTATEGEACTVPTNADEAPTRACADGLECLAGVCTATCDPDAPSCDAGRGCLRIWDSVRTTAAGACLAPCDEYATDGCSEGFACQPLADFAFSRTTAWACLPTGDEALALGDTCDPGRDVCPSGAHCVALSGSAGETPRCAAACDTNVFGWECGEGMRCAPTLRTPRGTCVDECAPFPTDAEACGDDNVCQPLLGGGGGCRADESVSRHGADCGVARSFGVCEDGGYCVEVGFGDTIPRCGNLCRPFAAESDCAEGEVCNPRPMLDGHGAVGMCDRQPGVGEVGDPCDAPGHACAADGTICADTGDGPTCRRACAGPVDCGESRCEWSVAIDGLLVRGQTGLCALE